MSAPLVPPEVMDLARGMHEAAMTSTCQVLRQTRTIDPRTGQTKLGPWVESGAPVRCLVDRSGGLSPVERVVADRIEGESFAQVQVPIGTDILGTDRLQASTTIAGMTEVDVFEVIGQPGAGSYSTALQVPCRMVK